MVTLTRGTSRTLRTTVPAGTASARSLPQSWQAAGTVVRQVRDVPLVKVTITEHRIHKRACGCGAVTSAAAPTGVDGPAVYGPNLRAIAVYLVVFQHVPVERAAALIADLTGATPSTGWVTACVARTAAALGEVEKLIKTLLVAAVVIGVDETTLNIAGTKQWLHVARTEKLTAYHLHTSRGRNAVTEFGVLPGYTGTIVRDALSVYDIYPATHALCGAHLIREPEILRFTDDLAVPFTNNGSERDLRPVKTQVKISGCHRATTGAQAWLRIRGYISTVGKHGDDVLTALHDAITGNPWQPESAPAT